MPVAVLRVEVECVCVCAGWVCVRECLSVGRQHPLLAQPLLTQSRAHQFWPRPLLAHFSSSLDQTPLQTTLPPWTNLPWTNPSQQREEQQKGKTNKDDEIICLCVTCHESFSRAVHAERASVDDGEDRYYTWSGLRD